MLKRDRWARLMSADCRYESGFIVAKSADGMGRLTLATLRIWFKPDVNLS